MVTTVHKMHAINSMMRRNIIHVLPVSLSTFVSNFDRTESNAYSHLDNMNLGQPNIFSIILILLLMIDSKINNIPPSFDHA